MNSYTLELDTVMMRIYQRYVGYYSRRHCTIIILPWSACVNVFDMHA